MKRIADRFVAKYRGSVAGETLRERMESLAGLMNERDIPFEVERRGGTAGALRVGLSLSGAGQG